MLLRVRIRTYMRAVSRNAHNSHSHTHTHFHSHVDTQYVCMQGCCYTPNEKVHITLPPSLFSHVRAFVCLQGGHSPNEKDAHQAAELRYQVRRLSHHPSIAIWDGCNECGGGGNYATFVVTTIVEEDVSRPVWPSCPSYGACVRGCELALFMFLRFISCTVNTL